MMATRRPVARSAARMRAMRAAWPEKSPCEKLSRATFRPARISRSITSTDSTTGPMVATIFVLWSGSVIGSVLTKTDDDGTRAHRVVPAVQRRLVSGFGDVVRGGPRGIDGPPPPVAVAARQPEGVILPVPVDHHEQIAVSSRGAAQR